MSRLSGTASAVPSSRANPIRSDKLLSKILHRIVAALEARRVTPTPDMIDFARSEINRLLRDSGSEPVGERQLQNIVRDVIDQQKRSKTALSGPTGAVLSTSADVARAQRLPALSAPAAAVNESEPSDAAPSGAALPPAAAAAASSSHESVQRAKALLMNTSKKQRQMLADEEFARAAAEDRAKGIAGRVDDRHQHMLAMKRQRAILDSQIEEHECKANQERVEAMRRQKEMDEHIANHRALTRQEHQEAFDKAMREKQVREDQQRQAETERERQRTEEHNDQVRQCMMIREELAKQRREDLERKLREKAEWKKVLEDNEMRLQEKLRKKEVEREVDQKFQREYAESLDRVERQRAEVRAKKDARAQHFGKLADNVIQSFNRKQAEVGNKIEMEYQEQVRRTIEDENNRKQRNKERLLDCQETRRRQIAEKEVRETEEREEERRRAEALRLQNLEAQRQEDARRQAARDEAQRLKQFLNTQLQLQHFRETRPLMTSITRPESRARSMYSPQRYSPSLETAVASELSLPRDPTRSIPHLMSQMN